MTWVLSSTSLTRCLDVHVSLWSCQCKDNSSLAIPWCPIHSGERLISSLLTHSLTRFSAKGSPASQPYWLTAVSPPHLPLIYHIGDLDILLNCSNLCTDSPALCQLMSSLVLPESKTILKSDCSWGTCHWMHSLFLFPFLHVLTNSNSVGGVVEQMCMSCPLQPLLCMEYVCVLVRHTHCINCWFMVHVCSVASESTFYVKMW